MRRNDIQNFSFFCWHNWHSDFALFSRFWKTETEFSIHDFNIVASGVLETLFRDRIQKGRAMIKLASPGIEGSPVSFASQFSGRRRLESNQWLVGNPTIPSKYEFIGSPINEMSAKNSRKQLKINSLSEPSWSTSKWKVAFDGFCAAAFLAIIFGVSAWMLCH